MRANEAQGGSLATLAYRVTVYQSEGAIHLSICSPDWRRRMPYDHAGAALQCAEAGMQHGHLEKHEKVRAMRDSAASSSHATLSPTAHATLPAPVGRVPGPE